ncbi:MAG: shikimate kinase [Halodesulfurarchaeum sp.]
MDGRAAAPAAGTILNALATGYGSAFAIDEYVHATVTFEDDDGVLGRIRDHPDADVALIERSVELVLRRFDGPAGATVETESDVPMASGLKSSSAAANAAVLATLDALGEVDSVTREEAALIGVEAARDVGVTVTGAFDDASASMLGGVTITDNHEDTVLKTETVDWDVTVWVPPEQAFSARADVGRCERIAPMAVLVEELAMDGRYHEAMTVNGFAFAAALERPAEPMIEALPDASGVSLSGTGPSYVAVGSVEAMDALAETWSERDGMIIRTSTRTTGARVE